jgi:hypothetical protein
MAAHQLASAYQNFVCLADSALIGQLAAALFSIFATLSLWKLNPRKWLTWYFEHCAAAGGKVPANIQLFLPWNLSEEKKKELGNAGLPQGDDTS